MKINIAEQLLPEVYNRHGKDCYLDPVSYTHLDVYKRQEQMMKINMVEPNRDQPRKKFEEDALLELADSIKQFGVCLLYTSRCV